MPSVVEGAGLRKEIQKRRSFHRTTAHQQLRRVRGSCEKIWKKTVDQPQLELPLLLLLEIYIFL
jgi:hypothetical protein